MAEYEVFCQQIIQSTYDHRLRDIDNIDTVQSGLRQSETEQLAYIEHRRKANEKAEELLLLKLDETQRLSFITNGTFTVQSKHSSGITYTLSKNYTFNIQIKLFDKNIGRLCISVEHTSTIPICDMLLAQKLMLETDEERFVQTGNLALD